MERWSWRVMLLLSALLGCGDQQTEAAPGGSASGGSGGQPSTPAATTGGAGGSGASSLGGNGGAAQPCEDCDDGNECTVNECQDGACVPSPVADGSACQSDAGRCYEGACCLGCWTGATCMVGDALGACGNAGKLCNDCDDANDCSADSCAQGACVNTAQPDGSSCEADGRICVAGACGPMKCDASVNVLDSFSKSAIDETKSGTNAYVKPTSALIASAADSVQSALDGDWAAAESNATAAGYAVCADELVAIWKPVVGTEGSALWAIRFGPARGLIVEVPHSFYELYVLVEGRTIFDELETRALLTTGTHRCANEDPSGCSQQTSTCSTASPKEPEDYRISDMAHTEESYFHAVHTVLSDHFANDWIVSVHGMGSSSPGASISNGTHDATSAAAPAALFAEALQVEFASDTWPEQQPITVCNSYGAIAQFDACDGAPLPECSSFGAVMERDLLCATSNTQGRYTNGETMDACGTDSAKAAERFIHLEQNVKVRENIPNVVAAFDAVIP